MLRIFFFLVSLVSDYEILTDFAHRALIAGVVNAGILSLIVIRLASRQWLGNRG